MYFFFNAYKVSWCDFRDSVGGPEKGRLLVVVLHCSLPGTLHLLATGGVFGDSLGSLGHGMFS